MGWGASGLNCMQRLKEKNKRKKEVLGLSCKTLWCCGIKLDRLKGLRVVHNAVTYLLTEQVHMSITIL